jgi:hypothetical protein
VIPAAISPYGRMPIEKDPGAPVTDSGTPLIDVATIGARHSAEAPGNFRSKVRLIMIGRPR